jgi:hypothetical protein
MSGDRFDMSLYEALALLALVGVGGFAYYLYRKDTRPRTPGGPKPELPPYVPMVQRKPPAKTGDDVRK